MAIGNRRGAFTLIEMLVVIGIMLVLGSIIVGVSLKNSDRQKSLDGADRVSGWLLLAKQWALRDQAPRGVRLVIDNNPASPTYRMVVTRNPIGGDTQAMVGLQYIEQPDDWVDPGKIINCNGTNIVTTGNTWNGSDFVAPAPAVAFRGAADFSGGYNDPTHQPTWPVGPFDMLEIDSGTAAKIATIVTPTSSPPPSAIYKRSQVGSYADGTDRYEMYVVPSLATWSGTNWRIIRQPRPRPGESPLSMPRDVVIDLNANNLGIPPGPPPKAGFGWAPLLPLPAAGPLSTPCHIDIMFAPSGAATTTSIINGTSTTPCATDLKLWVRDVSVPPPVAGNPYLYGGEFFIVTVSIRTGLISVHPADRTLDTSTSPTTYLIPYSFSQDGRSSGL